MRGLLILRWIRGVIFRRLGALVWIFRFLMFLCLCMVLRRLSRLARLIGFLLTCS
nr:MAG TPA: hypothetical protein [Caudoviricetes sp.]DAT35823.1 MAG TPA: hypothetical protein [Caudoviricetes sp.]